MKNKANKFLGLCSFVAITCILLWAANQLPSFGNPQAIENHVSPRYIEKAYQETGAHNQVTAVLADYRSFDTLGESTVIFCAGIACLLILGIREREG